MIVPWTQESKVYWNRKSIHADSAALFIELSQQTRNEIAEAVRFINDNGLTPETFTQEDFRIPSFGQIVPDLRDRLDNHYGVIIIRGLDIQNYSESESEIISWGLANYLGQPIRQGLQQDKRLYTVTDLGAKNPDPARIGSTTRQAHFHNDNVPLEPRTACYIGFLCVSTAFSGGESKFISAYSVHKAISDERPDLIPLLYAKYEFEPRLLHRWQTGPPTRSMPIFEEKNNQLITHYARVLIEPGMEIAGRPLTNDQTEALDFLDSVLDRQELFFEYGLRAGEMLFVNNHRILHGKTVHQDRAKTGDVRMLKRIWLWRRHAGVGVDPVALDNAEFAATG